PGHLKIGVSVRHIFKPISYLEIQLLSGVSGGYIMRRASLSVLMAKICRVSSWFRQIDSR
ncbi:hypothetical protein, partial [Klebsiella oxytoca]|uniref:hypothetical protein n=1 Tax=Klebsiella oxytoca TaxID=571 RepID=UPI0021CBEB41